MVRIVKSISFNLDDPVEKEIFEVANKGGYFSKNTKRMMASFLIHYPVLQVNKEKEKETLDFESFAFGEEDEEI